VKGETFLRHQRTIYSTSAAEMEKYIRFYEYQGYKGAVIEVAGGHASSKMTRWLKLGTEAKRDMERNFVSRRLATDTEAFGPILFYWANYGCSVDSDPARMPNAEVGWDQDTGTGLCILSLSATRAIKPGQEILWDYNPDVSFSFYTRTPTPPPTLAPAPTPAEEGSGGSSGGEAPDAELLQALSQYEEQVDAHEWSHTEDFDGLAETPPKRLRIETVNTDQQSLGDGSLPAWEWNYTGLLEGEPEKLQKGGVGDNAYFLDEIDGRVDCYLVHTVDGDKCVVEVVGVAGGASGGRRSVPLKLLQVVGS
jgi:hypothetical protein